MSLYQFLIFIHVLGAVALFVAIAIEAVSLGRLRRAVSPGDARGLLVLFKLPVRLGGAAMAATVASGAWMMAMSWGYQHWIAGALVAVFAMGVLAGVVSRRLMRRLRAALAGRAAPQLSSAMETLGSSTALVTSLRVRIALGIGILALMTMKPSEPAIVVLVLLAAALVALVASIPLAMRPESGGSIRNQRTVEAPERI